MAIGSSLTIDVLSNDTDVNENLDVTSVVTSITSAEPQSDGTIVYTPPADTDTSAPVTFTYTVKDDEGAESNAATVTVTVTEAPNVAPLAADDTPTEAVAIGSSLTIDVLANDTATDAELDVSSVVTSIETAVPQTDGTIVYTPPADTDLSEPAIFTYTVMDDNGEESNTATVTVTVIAANGIPIAENDTATVSPGDSIAIAVLANDNDSDSVLSETATVEIVSEPANGSATVQSDGTVLYTHVVNEHAHHTAGSDTFSYKVIDVDNGESAPATVTVVIVQSGPGPLINTHHEMIPNPVHNSNFRVAAACRTSVCFWDSPNTWVTGTTPDSDSLVIVDGQVRIRDLDAVARSIVVYPGGELSFATNSNTQLEVADLVVLEDSTLEIGTASSPIAVGNTAEVIFRDLQFDANDPGQHLRGLVVTGGVVKVFGRTLSDSFIRTAGEPGSGSNQIALTQSALNAGWRVGDVVVIPTSRQCAVASGSCSDQTETRTIQAISGNGLQLTLNQALQFDHPGARDHAGTLDFTPHVINKSRNVIFRSENPQGVRGHMLFHGRADVDMRYAEINGFGRTDIRDLGATNQKGRYPLHAHHLIGPVDPQANGYQFTFVGNTIDFGAENRQQDRKWGVSIHGSHYGLIERNIVDYASGAAIVTESGEEVGNMFSENFVVRVVGGNGERLHDPDPGDGSKLGRAGTGFWFNGGGRNFFHNNVAAAVVECVYCYGFKFDNVSNGTLNFPTQQGADPHMGGGQNISADAVGLNNFVGNEAYAVPNGLTIWWECTVFETPNDNCSSNVDSFRVWHHHRWGYFGYETNNMTLDNFTVRGDAAILSNRFENVVGIEFSDYLQRNLTIVNADIQNVSTGINMSSMRDERFATGPVSYTHLTLPTICSV